MRSSLANSITAVLAFGSGFTEAANLRKREQAVTVTQTVTASTPEPTVWQWDLGGSKFVPIHQSCNATERALLQRGFEDAYKLAQHAQDHILRFGNSSDYYQKYFGNSSTAEPIGWYDKIVNGDKTGVWFRCDDIDGNCHQDGKITFPHSTPQSHWWGESIVM